jgi:hypothetical protein
MYACLDGRVWYLKYTKIERRNSERLKVHSPIDREKHNPLRRLITGVVGLEVKELSVEVKAMDTLSYKATSLIA